MPTSAIAPMALPPGDGHAVFPYTRDAADACDGIRATVTQDELHTARRHPIRVEGPDACLTSAASLADVRVRATAGWSGHGDVARLDFAGPCCEMPRRRRAA